MEKKLSFTKEELLYIAQNNVPPIVYTLEEGYSRKDISFPKNIGDWGLGWTATDGRDDKGMIIIYPNNSVSRKIVVQTQAKRYETFGFSVAESLLVAEIKVPEYWNDNVIRCLRALTDGTYDYSMKTITDLEFSKVSEEFNIRPTVLRRLLDTKQELVESTIRRILGDVS